MPVSFLQQAVDEAAKPKSSLISLLKQEMQGNYPARGFKHIHASDITKESFCPRQVALLDITKLLPKKEFLQSAQRATFDIGHAISDLVREKWLGQRAIGHWHCLSCGEVRNFCTKPAAGCKTMKTCLWKYREIEFKHLPLGFVGSIDVLVNVDSLKLQIVEVKIITPVDFEKLIAPLAEHRIRTNLYMHLVEHSASAYRYMINTQRAKVLYVSRAFGKKHPDHNDEILPFREFEVARNDGELAPYLQKAEQVRLFRQESKLPGRICETSFCKLAKNCPVLKQCFSGSFIG